MAPLLPATVLSGLIIFYLTALSEALILQSAGAIRESYDYVIVGGGTAGLTIGDRLSEDEETTVLVIENGGISHSDQINMVRDRDAWSLLPWELYNLTSAPNAELHNQVASVPAASIVGGSSGINGMQVLRGTRGDYNRWGEFFDDPKIKLTWSWDGMLPYFKKALYFQEPSDEGKEQMPGLKYNEKYWGQESRLYAGWPTFQWPGTHFQFDTYLNLSGVRVPEDSGSGKPGVYWYPTYMDAMHTVTRSYAYTAHWEGIQRQNYDLLVWSKATKINLSSTNRKATGVTFRPNDGEALGAELPKNVTYTTVKAHKEVIISAGTFHSPQILQLSGIGPRKLLEEAGIDVKVELPVGQSFHDHNCLIMNITFQNYTVYPNRRDNFTSPEFVRWADQLWAANRTGPWSRVIWNSGAWLPFPTVAPDIYSSIADQVESQTQHAAQYLPAGADASVVAGYAARLKSLSKALRSEDEVFYSHYFSGDQPVMYFTYEHPLSFGTVNINTTHPSAEPIVDYRTYSNPLDFDIMIALAEFHRRINEESPSLTQFAPLELSPGRNVTSREDWIAYLRNQTLPTAEHPSGSCPMMPLELGGVVDDELKVYGVEGLRIVDASVLNLVPGANIAGTVFAVAEKAADMIKKV